MRKPVARLLIPRAFLVAAACGATQDGGLNGGTSGTANGGSSMVRATLEDFSITLDSASAPAGEVTFDVTNRGPSYHEFLVIRTTGGVALDGLPVEGDVVNEDGLDIVDELEGIDPNGTGGLTVDLTPGDYIVICNIEGHYQAGMRAALSVD